MRQRWHWPQPLGPLFGYDLVASTRRGQHAALRVLIATGLLVVVYFVYLGFTHDRELFTNPFKPSRLMSPNDLAKMAHALVVWCLIVQFVAVWLLTPSVVADAIAREKERRALDFLFVTDLTNGEIIFGKLGARLAYLTGVLLTGLPILSLTQLFGGVDPMLLYGGYAALFATLLSLGVLSMLCSVSSQTALQATVLAYAACTALLTVCGCLLIPIFASGLGLSGVLTYVILHLAFAGVSLLVCVRELRPWSAYLAPVPAPISAPGPRSETPAPRLPRRRRPAHDDEPPFVLPADESVPVVRPLTKRFGEVPDEPWRPVVPPLPVWEPPLLPPVDDERPLLWKEVYLHSFTRGVMSETGPLFLTYLFVLILGGLIGGGWLLLALFFPTDQESIMVTSNILARIGTVILGGMLGLTALMHATNSVTRERERDTLDGLLILPVERTAILEAKWLGGLVSLKVAVLALGLLWLVGLLTGGIHPLALGRLVLAVAASVEFLASLGLWLSVVCRSSLRANMAAALCLLLVASGPWIVVNYVEIMTPTYGPRSQGNEVVMQALMPPVTWTNLCLTWAEYRELPAHRADYLLGGSLVYAGVAWLLWRDAVRRFRQYGGGTKSG